MFPRRKRSAGDFDAEIRAHLDAEIERLRQDGLSDQDARAAAHRVFGNVLRVREQFYERGRWLWADHAWQDLRYALRTFRRSPGAALAVIATMALAIGATSAIFTIVHTLLFRPLPYPESDRLVGIVQYHLKSGNPEFAAFPDYEDWRDQSRTLESVAGAWMRFNNLTGIEEPERLEGAAVTANLFSVLRVNPALGRTFAASGEDPQTVILGERLWRRRFNGAADVVGRVVQINGAPHTVVGVMPRGFAWPESSELWVPLVKAQSMDRGYHMLQVVGRLAPEATVAAAQSELDTIAARAAANFPTFNKDWGVEVSSLRQYTAGSTARPVLILFGAVLCVLLTACANVAGLLASRAVTRRHEMSLRGALGAGRGRIVRQLLTESLLLAIAGGVLGITLAAAAIDPLLSLTTLPRMREISIDVPILVFSLATSVVTGLIFGLAPAISASRLDLRAALTQRAPTCEGWLRPTLLAAEIAVAIVLIAGAGLLLRSFVKLQRVETGFESDKVLTARFFLPRASYPVERCMQLYQEMIERMKALPGVETAAAVSAFPFSGTAANIVFAIEGRPPAEPGQQPDANLNVATPGYLEALGISLLRGRTIEASDRSDSPFVAVVNQEMAARFFPGEDPIGKSIRVLGPKPRTIVGIVENIRTREFQTAPQPEFYIPHAQYPTGGMYLVVRASTGDPAHLAPAVRATLRALDPDLPIASMRTGKEVLASTLSARRFSLLLMSMFAAMTLALSILGVYSVQSYAVAQRTKELGIRVALGAARHDILRLVVRQGMMPVVVGAIIGLGLSFAATTVLSKMLFEVRSFDPPTLAGAVCLLTGTALVASLIPGRRAARLDPMTAMRQGSGE